MELKTIFINGVEYFPATECVKMLGYKNPHDAIKRHCKESEVATIKAFTNGGVQDKKYISKNNALLLISKSKILTLKQKEDYINNLTNKNIIIISSRKEIEFIEKLERLLKLLNLKSERQYHIKQYRIDLYIYGLNIAIEYDEDDHNNYDKFEEEKRESIIIKELGCEIVRVSDKNSDEHNIGLIVKKIMELSNSKKYLKNKFIIKGE